MSSISMNHTDIATAKKIMSGVILNGWINGFAPQNVMLHGSPGTGKSAAVKQMVSELQQEMRTRTGRDIEVRFIDIRLGSMESSEVNGIPYNKEVGIDFVVDVNGKSHPVSIKEMAFSTPAWFPRPEKDVYYILFLDELTNASISVQHAAYRLLLDRDIQNGTKLPETVAIIGAGNLREDKTGAKPLAPAAANRFAVHLIIDRSRNFDSAFEFMVSAGFSEEVVGYLTWKPDNLYSISHDDPAWASNRTWEFVDGHIKNEFIRNDETVLMTTVAGAVGSAIAIDFMGYLEFRKALPDFKKIRSGEDTYKMPNENGVKFAVTTALAYQIVDIMNMTEGDPQAEMDNLCKVVEQGSKEMLIVMFRTVFATPSAGARVFKYPALREVYKTVASSVKNISQGIA